VSDLHPKELAEELQKLHPSALVEFFELDTSPTGEGSSDSPLCWHNGTQGIDQALVFNDTIYNPLPIKVTGFEFSGEGRPPRPTMSISNIGGWMSSLMLSRQDLTGAILTRRRTFVKHLEGMPDAGNIQLPIDVYYISRKTRENRQIVEFELASALDLDGLFLPARKILAEACTWDYRGEGCAFGGLYVVSDSLGRLVPGARRYRGLWVATDTYGTVTVGSEVYRDSVGFAPSGDYFGVYEVQEDDVTGIANSPSASPSKWARVQRYRGVYDATVSDYAFGDVVQMTASINEAVFFAYVFYPTVGYVPAGARPPNDVYWKIDFCAKFKRACLLRYDPLETGRNIPFGGFLGSRRIPQL